MSRSRNLYKENAKVVAGPDVTSVLHFYHEGADFQGKGHNGRTLDDLETPSRNSTTCRGSHYDKSVFWCDPLTSSITTMENEGKAKELF